MCRPRDHDVVSRHNKRCVVLKRHDLLEQINSLDKKLRKLDVVIHAKDDGYTMLHAMNSYVSNGFTNLGEESDHINWSCLESSTVCSTDVSNAVTPERCILASPSGSAARKHDGNRTWHNESAPCALEYTSSRSGSTYQRHLSHVYQIATAARAGHNVSKFEDDVALSFDVNALAVSTTPPSRYCSDSSWDAVKPERLSSVNQWLSMEENWVSYSSSSSSLDYCPSQELHDASNVESPLPPPFPGYTRVHLNL